MSAAPVLPVGTRLAIFLRLLAIQSAWNYETLVGNGIGFSVEPALRLLPGGVGGEAYKSALARQSQYFNTHPYLASVAVGALARVELDQEDPTRIVRFRTALCGPLGAAGDRLVWAAWLPFSVLLGLLAFGLGGGAGAVVLTFLVAYNVGHLALRIWGLRQGYALGMQVARALAVPVLRSGAQWVSRAGAALAGVAIPLAISRGIGEAPTQAQLAGLLAAVGAIGLGLSRLKGRYELWKWSLGILTLIALVAMVRA
ncbi:MAG: PTS system mannose/fructose/sorbose family transporter subunit IID [Gemmatimonadaceae bacterium]|nr:PTS system mannose/fructose/sorbose family transporter subunit IID [Gemmatimonadaceae bacterium]